MFQVCLSEIQLRPHILGTVQETTWWSTIMVPVAPGSATSQLAVSLLKTVYEIEQADGLFLKGLMQMVRRASFARS